MNILGENALLHKNYTLMMYIDFFFQTLFFLNFFIETLYHSEFLNSITIQN